MTATLPAVDLSKATITRLEHGGVTITIADYRADGTYEELSERLWANIATIADDPRGSVRLLVDLRGVRFNPLVANAFRDGGKVCDPQCRAMAALGVTGVMKVIHQSISRLLRRQIPLFDTPEEAIAWLARQ